MPIDWFKDNDEKYMKKLIDWKMLACETIGWEFFTEVKIRFLDVLERMTCKDLFDVSTRAYPHSA